MPLLLVEETGRFRLEVPVEESGFQPLNWENVPVKMTPPAVILLFTGLSGKFSRGEIPRADTYLVKVEPAFYPHLRRGCMVKPLSKRSSVRECGSLSKAVLRQGQLEGVFVVDAENMPA